MTEQRPSKELVAQLRHEARDINDFDDQCSWSKLMQDAADEIERLRVNAAVDERLDRVERELTPPKVHAGNPDGMTMWALSETFKAMAGEDAALPPTVERLIREYLSDRRCRLGVPIGIFGAAQPPPAGLPIREEGCLCREYSGNALKIESYCPVHGHRFLVEPSKPWPRTGDGQ